ncbi:MAG: adenosylcobinamide-GDP ribazoletransferase [Candidatus Devosia phytovorans]|uniref:Adenosylcobinamide-GDP ribazoletransferase n=1 Tax=Candidatus Devosia phytovorans TaxID=3121372 RepID=A0AAJ6AZ18_9HYPH|nr:adenosylcobinamide-GDP ribazoletransferase [Devosia sp.]WEK02739.1 MAG: adenosylcobinamide-GDP ribazoletransferase [Devosia sp.]
MNPDEPSADPEAPSQVQASGLWGDFIMALRFFSRLPTGRSPHVRPDLGRMAMVLPLASLVIGLGPALVLVGGVWIGLPGYFAATLAVGAMAVVSGAMAEDALADAMDGLFGGHCVERRLEIMKDSRHGTYGVTALALFILLRVMALGAIAAVNPLAAGAEWLAANIVGRSAAMGLAVVLPPARRDGASATAGRVPGRSFAVGAGFAAVLLFVLGVPATSVAGMIAALLVAVVVVVGWTLLCRKLVGGQSGDLIGAAGALCEIGVLTALLVFV